ncbi:MAG: threonine aldolase family protein [Candidatus Eremiobacteraeota bacterium]|nr:threonine aldolase family protein [Candidatus Eremiobacteraeota bacterium]
MIDLFSDTTTRPTEAMRRAIAQAEVGDEQRHHDPNVLKLIEAVCAKLGKPAGLYLPSGTMCNLIAVKTHTRMGDACFVGHNCHILRSETGAASAVSGVVLEAIKSENGCFTAAQLSEALYDCNPYTPRPSLVCVEQSHNFAGGAIWPLKDLREIKELANARGLKVHMDGARLFNAAVASGSPAHEHAAGADSVWVDFTKGLGAPLGAVLCGEEDFIAEARRYKHMFGGALRQAGMMAAGCLYALEHHVERLADDHRRAADLASFLRDLPGVTVKPVDTNLIFFNPGVPLPEFMAHLEQHGVMMSNVGEWVRAVTHLDVDDKGIEAAKAAISSLFALK